MENSKFCLSEKQCSNCDDICKMLRQAKLRPTKQRLALGELLFKGVHRHITAEQLFEEAEQTGITVSLATVYNTLHQLTGAGLLKAVSIDSSKTYFDTNTGDHHHYFLEDSNEIFDMPHGKLSVDDIPAPPEGMEISSVDIVVRLRKTQA